MAFWLVFGQSAPPVRFGLKLSFLITLIAALAFAGCDQSTSPGPAPDLSGTITISPSGSVTTGTQLTASYSGSETVSYQWNKDGTALSGATNATYTPGEAGSYTVTVSAAGYQNKTSAAVTVTVDPVVLMNAEDFGVGVTPTTLTISNPGDFSNAKTAIEGTAGNYVLNITTTVDVGNVNITPKAGAIVSLRGGGTLHLSSGTDGLFKLDGAVGANRKLILRDAVLKGHAGASRSLVSVVISSAEFVMYGGTITGNTAAAGGGVYVDAGTFTMSGGTISGNTAKFGGGGVVINGSTFTKTGGTITGNNGSNPNTATDGFNGRYGHAVYVLVNGSTADRYRNADAGPGVNISTTSDLGTAQGTAPWL
ncbi:hypothetical protein AGMMS50268_12270 [Spirochaetia bacterium]|nr:hypothetical protein AGMMS50268_12270 [Spirochaetia bacterium]